MQHISHTLVLVVAFGVASPAVAQLGLVRQRDPAFDLHHCTANATHILVVDAHGRLVEVWKGVAVLGDRVPLEKFFSPVLPRPASLWADSLSLLCDELDNSHINSRLFESERLILFLVKSDRQDEATRFLECWLPAARNGWFASSAARVDWTGYVLVVPPTFGCCVGVPDSGFRGSYALFKADILDRVREERPPWAK